MSRTIVHLDADAFFASVEQAADPRLRDKPVAVGGENRGIIASASYEARKYGIYTPMPTVRARKLCPKLIVLPGDFEKYEQFSRWMFSYAYDFTPEVEISSIDEGYFDLSGTRKSPVSIAETIRHAIRDSLKITVSEGIASNKLVSQVASKWNKPAAFTRVGPGEEKGFLHPLPNCWLPGIGPKTATRLNTAGLARIGQIAATPLELLHLLLGNMAPSVKEFADGRDERPVIPVSAPAKSYSEQETFAADVTNEEFVRAVLRRQADHLMRKVRQDSKSIRTLTVKVRYNDMAEEQCGESLPEPTDLETDIYSRLESLLRRAWQRRVSLRMVSVKLSNIYDGFFPSELLLECSVKQQEARHRLPGVLDQLRKTHGSGVVLRGHDFFLERLTQTSVVAQPSVVAQTSKSAVSQVSKPANRSEPVNRSAFKRSADLSRYAGGDTAGLAARAPIPGANVSCPSWREKTANRLLDYNRAGMILSRSPRLAPSLPLSVHSYYSFLDSTLSINAIIELAKRHDLPAIALTDSANLHGAVEFAHAAKAAGLKPIIGAEIQVAGQQLRLYVQNATGYTNLCRILSAFRPAPSSESPRSKRERAPPVVHLLGMTDGLLATSPGAQLASFFPGRFYLEIENPEKVNGVMGAGNLAVIASLPIHYAAPEERLKYDILQSIRTLTLLRQGHPEKRASGAFHFRTAREMNALFSRWPEALAHTLEIAERCSFEFPLGRPQFPAFVPPDGSPGEFLRRLVLAGACQRYGVRWQQIKPQIEEELAIIGQVGYEEYFLVVWDILQECRRRGIDWLTRGSAADSLVCYCLGISDVCPIRFDLYFRRFLNKDRMQLNKLPDIDVDFPHDRKDDVIDLIFEKYGAEHVAVVGGFSTYQARGAVADIAKVLGVSDYQIRRFTEHFPWARAQGISEALKQTQECRDLPLEEEPYATALKMAEFLDGFPRYPKMHPCGVVISRQSMMELTPTFISNKGYPTTHFDMDAVEAIGLVKIDILAQGGLAVMRDVNKMRVAQTSQSAVAQVSKPANGSNIELSADLSCHAGGATADLETCATGLRSLQLTASTFACDDPAVWEMIASGGARAVHHIESPAMISLCRQCNVREIDGLIAIVSVIRPGAANEQKKTRFVRRYQGLEPVTYPHLSLESCLKSTFGLVVYEEHILQICEAFAGLPAGRADILRRALGKQKQSVIDEIQKEFFAVASARGHSPEKIAEVWQLVTGFAGYAFCKAHSTAYGVEAYQSAWLKKYFPAEFMAAVLTNGKGFYHPLVYVLECHRLGIPLLPPSINEPGPGFTVVANHIRPDAGTPQSRIRAPVTRIKGLTEQTKEKILREFGHAPFESLRDFYRRVRPLAEEMEALIRVGALDVFGRSRTEQFWESQFLQRAFPEDASGQGWLFPPREPEFPPDVREPTRRERLQAEMELLEFPASGHPLELHDDIAWETYCPVARLGEYAGQEVVSCGLVIEQRTHHQVTGEPMKFLSLADWTGMVETELFASTYRNYGLATVRYPVLEVVARVEAFENGRGHSLRVLRAGKPRLRCRGFAPCTVNTH